MIYLGIQSYATLNNMETCQVYIDNHGISMQSS